MKGAYDRSGDDDGQGIHVKYLRPKGDHYSVILACFHNDDSGETFTIAQLLYLAADKAVQKVYCFSREERSIQADFAGLNSTDAVLKTLDSRGFRVTRKHVEFEAWFNKATRVKSKAMEVLNQTVAVKDIQRLNDFIRNHMLEPQDWGEKVDRLLGHFTQLNEAHQSLVRVRQQFDLLEPIARFGREYQERASELTRLELLQAAVDAFLAQQTVEFFTPQLTQRREQLAHVLTRKDTLSKEIKTAQDQCRRLLNEIDQAGGARLREIPLLIQSEQAHADQKSRESDRFHAALQGAGIAESVHDAASFSAVQRRLPAVRKESESALSQNTTNRDAIVLQRGHIRQDLESYSRELEGLNRRKENLPEWCVALRQSLCEQLGLAVRDLPFAAELIAVDPDERDWEASIEKVLRGFALSLLVPERFYHLVSRHVDRTKLTDGRGRGGRLVYLRVGDRPRSDSPASKPQSLLCKLVFREGHPLLPWVRAELNHRYDHRCCDSIEAFQQCRPPAMTRSRHVKSGAERHEKDDRDEIADPRNFVLGWDNREKKQRIAAEIERLRNEETDLSRQVNQCDDDLDEARNRLGAVKTAIAVADFTEIDFQRHEREVTALEKERRAIEDQSETIQQLKQRLAKAQSTANALEVERELLIKEETLLERDIGDADRLIRNATAELQCHEASGMLEQHRECFPELKEFFAETFTTAENFLAQKDSLRAALEQQAAQVRHETEPLKSQLLEAMVRFLRNCPEEHDLRANVDYLDSFLGLRQRIVEEDLPRHERRFKERLNEKIIHEIGLFRSELERERRSIEDSIELLNVSLARLEYRPGTHIQLEQRPVRDREIVAFQQKLRECIEGSFDDSPEANEARFLRIQELVRQLGDEGNRRWRDKITDVGRWFDFVASVIDRQSLKAVSSYQDSSGQSGGEKAKLAFTILVAAIAYQYDLDPEQPARDRFRFVVVDEMFSKVDDQHAEYALELFRQFGLQLLIVAPLDAKARVTQPYVGCYLYVDKRDHRSEIFEMTAREFEQSLDSPQ